jgi:hypothetical protein
MNQFHVPQNPHGPQPGVHSHVPGGQACPGQGASYVTGGPEPAPKHLNLQQEPQYYQYGANDYGYLPVPTADGVRSWFDFSDSCYMKGLLLGAGVTVLLTNASVQKALVRGTVKLWSFVQGGVEEVKEQFQDIKAEMSQKK